jgi:hypothetical protein
VLAAFEHAGAEAPSTKMQDAEAVLRATAEWLATDTAAPAPGFTLERTVFFDRLCEEVRRDREGLLPQGDLTRAVADVLVERELERMGVAIPPAQTRDNLDALRRELGLWRADETMAWLQARGLSLDDLVAEANRLDRVGVAARANAAAVAAALRRASRLPDVVGRRC